jgi:hypothetical protein
MWKIYIVWAARAVAGLGLLVTVLLYFLILARPTVEPDVALQDLNISAWLLLLAIPLYVIWALIQAGELPALWPPNGDPPEALFDPRQRATQWIRISKQVVIFGLIEIGVLIYAFYLNQAGRDAALSAAQQSRYNVALLILGDAQLYAIALIGLLRARRSRYL